MIKWLLKQKWFQKFCGLCVAAVIMHLAYKQKRGLTRKGMIFCVTIDVLWKLWWLFVICYLFWWLFFAPVPEGTDLWFDPPKNK